MIELPEAWRAWPTAMEVQFHLTEMNSIAREAYADFAAQDIEEAANKLFAVEKDHWLYPGYRLHTKDFVAALAVWVDWPLLRKVGEPRVTKRDGPRTDAIGLSYGADDTLIYLWQEPIGPFGLHGQLRLSAGGRTLSDAIAAYDFLAPQLRRYRRQLRQHPTDTK